MRSPDRPDHLRGAAAVRCSAIVSGLARVALTFRRLPRSTGRTGATTLRYQVCSGFFARVLTTALVLTAVWPRPVAAETRVDRNVVYGMYSGLALLLDVYVPDRPNGYGVVFISGSGWSAPLGYGAPGLKSMQVSDWSPELLGAGYTVFAINHRATPRF